MSAQSQAMTANTLTLQRAGAAAQALTNPQQAAAGAIKVAMIAVLAAFTIPIWVPLGALYGDMPKRVPLNPLDEPAPVRFVQWISAIAMAAWPFLLVLFAASPALVIATAPAFIPFLVSPFLVSRRIAASKGVQMTMREWAPVMRSEVSLNPTRFIALTVTPLLIGVGAYVSGWVPLQGAFVGAGIAWGAVLWASARSARRIAMLELGLREETLRLLKALAGVFKTSVQDLVADSVVTPTNDGGVTITNPGYSMVTSFDAAEADLARVLPHLELVSATMEALVLGPVSPEVSARREAFVASGGMDAPAYGAVYDDQPKLDVDETAEDDEVLDFTGGFDAVRATLTPDSGADDGGWDAPPPATSSMFVKG